MKIITLILFLSLGLVSCTKNTSSASPKESISQTLGESKNYTGTGSITQGMAVTKIESLLEYNQKGSRIAGVGGIKDTKSTVCTVPGVNHFNTAPMAFDLCNEDSGIKPTANCAITRLGLESWYSFVAL